MLVVKRMRDQEHIPGWPASILTYRDALLHVLMAAPDRIILYDRAEPIRADGFLDRIGIMLEVLHPHALVSDAPHRRIGLALHDNIWSMAAQIACWFLRLSPLQLDHRQSADDLRKTVRSNGLALVITRQKRLLAAAAEVMLIADPAGLLADAALVAKGRASLQAASQVPAGPDDLAEFLTSSGVSGPPKIYPATQAQLLAMTMAVAGNGERGDWGAALAAVSIVFGGARLIWTRNLLYGRPIHALPLLFTIVELDQALRDPQIAECTLPPHLIRALVQHATQDPGSAPRYPHLMKLQSIGGPALDADKLAAQERLSAHYVMTYSSTETGVVARISGADLRHRPGSCGRPLHPELVDIVDDAEVPLPPGAIGRIRVKRPYQLECETKIMMAWPGDLGWLDEDGYLFIAARGDGIICKNGVNYASAMVEAKLLDCADVADVAVLRLPRAAGDDDTLIAVRPAGDHIAPQHLARALRQRLSSHEQPQAIILVGADDLTPGGKIRRQAVLEAYTDNPSNMVQI